MNNILPKEPPKMDDDEGTNVKRFLSMRGILLVKEFREINVVKCEYRKKINISTAIISTMATATTKGDVNYGLKLEAFDEDGRDDGSAFIDFDEFDELISAFDFIESLSKQMIVQKRDYTEVNFITKDNIKFGFYQSEGRQMGFINLNSYSDLTFVTIPILKFFKQNIEYAKNYLVSRGATH